MSSDNREPKGMHPLLVEGILLSILGVLAVIVAWLLLASPADGAPAPLPRPAPFDSSNPAGTYALTWDEGVWHLELRPGGAYHCRNTGGSTWEGRWWPSGASVLWVEERPSLGPGAWGEVVTWRVEWDRGEGGRYLPQGAAYSASGVERARVALKRVAK